MRVCVAYDCLFPWTVGGQERYLRYLAQELGEGGHEVTYITRRQWPDGEAPRVPGVRVVAVSPAEPLYDADGRRTIGEPLRYGRGVLGHLLRHRDDYDVVHLCAFPYFSLIAARLALLGRPTRLFVDWQEVWSDRYWGDYLGPTRARLARGVQRLCARLTPVAFVFSDLHHRRLREAGFRGPAVRLPGPHAGELRAHPVLEPPGSPLVLFIGRHIPEKRAPVVPAAVAAARGRVPELRGLVLGDGPEREAVLAEIDRRGLRDVVDAPGFVGNDAVDEALERATCLLAPSSREGYGLAVVEAAAAGTPAIVVRGPDNASVERIDEDVNGFIAADADPDTLADAIVRAHEGARPLRERTAAWFEQAAPALTGRAAARVVERTYLAGR